MTFGPGKSVLLLTILALASGMAILLRPAARGAQMHVWVFDGDDQAAYRSVVGQFARQTGETVAIDLLGLRPLDLRLVSLFMSPGSKADVPDLVEIEMSSMGKYFRPPANEIGLLPLNDFLRQSGYLPQIAPSRLAPWTKDGEIFGVPLDMHPVTLTFRQDLFTQAGVNLDAVTTWPQFQTACLQYQKYWRRSAIELDSAQVDDLAMMLLQRHINLVDAQDHLHFDDPKVAETVAIYAQMVAGPNRIGVDPTPGAGGDCRDLADGTAAAMMTPDWKYQEIMRYEPQILHQLKMRPLPIFQPGDAPTSTWGATMMGIPRHAKDPAMSWKLLQFLALTRECRQARFAATGAISAMPQDWNGVNSLFARLADQVPSRCVTAYTSEAQAALTLVLDRAVTYLRDGQNPAELQAACADWLREASQEIQLWIDQGRISP
ncbi:MAG TPA: extracellular solute-binding protein [Tepidisphaeraceae bacterium]|nr:extracellular solute-binding protein [Tepidisphaeraceae bacterium]